MGTGVVKLGSWASVFVMGVRITLHLKSVSYEFLQETFDSKSELLLKSNPVHKKMSVLIHADKPVCESNIIVQYIDDAWNLSRLSLLPSNLYDQAIARFWAVFVDEKFIALRSILIAKGEEETKIGIAQVEESTQLLEKAFMDCSNGNPFFNGYHIGYLNIALGSFLGWLKVDELDINHKKFDDTKTPSLAQWAERLYNDTAVKPIMPEISKLAEFARKAFPKHSAN